MSLALSVALFHWNSPARFVSGPTAVILFYIISGFYMALVLNEKYNKNSSFYWSRFLRIFPLYWACLILAVIYGFWIGWNSDMFAAIESLSLVGKITDFFMNFAIFGRGWHQTAIYVTSDNPGLMRSLSSVFGVAMFRKDVVWLGQAWTLDVELCFYLVAPLIVRSPKRIAILLGLSLLLRLGLIVWPHHPGPSDAGTWGYHNLPTTLCIFLLGSVAYRVYAAIASGPHLAKLGLCLSPFLLALGAADATFSPYGLAAHAVGAIRYDSPRMWLVYLLFAACLPFIFNAYKSLKWDRAIGELSYAVYLLHGMVGGVVFALIGGRLPALAQEMIALVALVVVSFAVNFAIESGVVAWLKARLRDRRSSKLRESSPPSDDRQATAILTK